MQTESSIYEKEMKIKALERASVQLRKKIISHREVILEYLANMYSEGNLIFDDEGEVDIIKTLVLTEEDTSFYITDMTYKTIISELGQKLIAEYHALVREYYVNSVKTNEERMNLEELKQSLKKQKENLDIQRKEKEKLLEITK